MFELTHTARPASCAGKLKKETREEIRARKSAYKEARKQAGVSNKLAIEMQLPPARNLPVAVALGLVQCWWASG